MQQPPAELGHTTADVAATFRVSVQTVRRWRRDGHITGHLVGREIRYTTHELNRFTRERLGPLAEPAA